MRYTWYYWNENWYISKFAIYDIINSKAGVYLNALYMVLLIAQVVYI